MLSNMSKWRREKEGESTRSAASSKSLRRGPEEVSTYEVRFEGGGESVTPSLPEDVLGGVMTPESTSRDSSSSRGGRTYCSHLVLYLSCSVDPSIFLRTSRTSSLSLCCVNPSFGDMLPKTSSTAALTFSIIRAYPRCSRYQENVKNLRLVSKSFPKFAIPRSSWFSRDIECARSGGGGCDNETTEDK